MGSRFPPSPLTGSAIDRTLAAGFGDGRLERVQVLHFGADGRALGHFVGPPGSADAAALPLRQLATDALAAGATGWLVAHNHPSGNIAPSRADLLLTRRLLAFGEQIGIEIVDHLIYAAGRRLSFREEGLL